MQKGVHSKFVDMSTSVREAAVELIGRFVLNKPELILQYYDMIIERILVSKLLINFGTFLSLIIIIFLSHTEIYLFEVVIMRFFFFFFHFTGYWY